MEAEAVTGLFKVFERLRKKDNKNLSTVFGCGMIHYCRTTIYGSGNKVNACKVHDVVGGKCHFLFLMKLY
jgi:hypothetical protein